MAYTFNPLSGNFDVVTFGANKTLSNLTATVAPNESMFFASGKTIRFSNDTYLTWRNEFDTSDISVLKLNSSGRIEIGNGTSQIRATGDFSPTADNTYNCGITNVLRWASMNAVTYYGSGFILGLQTLPGGQTGVAAFGGTAGIDLGFFTANRTDATASRPIYFNTGNNTVGASGGMVFRIGTAGTTRGNFQFIDASIGTAGHVLASTDTSGTTEFRSLASLGAVTSLTTIGAVPNANGATISSGVLNLQPADASFGGVVTTATQTFAGAKTFNNTTASTSRSTGAVIIGNGTAGGLGVGGRIHAGGLTTHASILAGTNTAYDIGALASRFNSFWFNNLKGYNAVLLTGTPTVTFGTYDNHLLNLSGDVTGNTLTATLDSGGGINFTSVVGYVDTLGGAGNIVDIQNISNGNISFGGASAYSATSNEVYHYNNGSGSGNFSFAYCHGGTGTGSTATSISSGFVSYVFGAVGQSDTSLAVSGNSALLQATNEAAFAQASVNIADGVSGVTAEATASGIGSGVRGSVTRGLARASNSGSLVSVSLSATSNTAGAFGSGQGCALIGRLAGSGSATTSGSASSAVVNITGAGSGSYTGSGAATLGVCQIASSGSVTISCIGGTFVGSARSTGAVSITGTAGNGAWGDAGSTGISVSGTINCFLFGQGSNSTASSVAIGQTLKFLQLTSVTPSANGEFGSDGTVVSIYSNGLQREIQKFYQNRNFSVTSVGNVGTGVDDLISHTLAASSMTVDGDYARHQGFGTFAANANNKQVRALWNGTEVVTTGAVAINGGTWESMVTIVRVSSTNARAYGRITVKDGAGVITTYYGNATIATTWTGTVVVKHTGEATSNNDIVQETGHLDRVRVS